MVRLPDPLLPESAATRWGWQSEGTSGIIPCMRATRTAAAAFTVVCLLIAGYSMLSSTSLQTCVGSTCSTVDCGSPAFPKALFDFDSPDDAANCAGATSASVGLYGVLLAGLGLGVLALTARRGRVDQSMGGPLGDGPGERVVSIR